MNEKETEGPYRCLPYSESLNGVVYRLFGPGIKKIKTDFSSERGAYVVECIANAAYAAGFKKGHEEKDLQLPINEGAD